jgi:uncharacterized protein YjiS (DUF1127 family)
MSKTTQLGSRHFHTLGTAAVPFGDIVRLAAECYRRAQSRRQLRELDDRLLADIGLSREAAREEARKPFWQA